MALRTIVRTLTAATVGTLTSPLITGGLLLALLRGPPQVRDPLLDLLQRLPGDLSLDRVLVILKSLFAFGIAKTANRYLNVVSQNGWRWTADTGSWTWRNEVALVTGGSAGIGAEIVKGLVAAGAQVVVFDIAPLDASLAGNARVHHFKVDVTNPDEINATAKQVLDRFGAVSVLVNNAGIGTNKLIVDNTPAYLQKIFGVNIFSHFYTVKAFLPAMLARNHGHVVTIASTAAFVSVPGIADYCATKAGVLSFHEALRREIINVHQKPGVLTTVVHPNWTRTALIAEHADTIERGQGPLLTPQFVGAEVVRQITGCRGGQVILPRNYTVLSTLKGWPNWLQEGLRGLVARQVASEFR